MRRLLVATVAATSLVLAGCGSDDATGGLDEVTVSKAAVPKVKVDKGFEATKTKARVVNPGSGLELATGDSVKVNYVAINGRTGKEFDNSFSSDKPLTLTLDTKTILAGFVKGLTGQKVGSRVLVAIAPKDGFLRAEPDLGIKKNDTMVFLFDVIAKVPTAAAGKSEDLPKSLPKLVLDSKSQPSKFQKTSSTALKQTKASAHVVIEGKGPAVTAEQTVTVQYLGQVYPAGKIFDTSWPTGAYTKPLAELIKCWQTELVGKKIGSRVVLVCPAKTAYAGTESELKDDTLIFSIDLLDAS